VGSDFSTVAGSFGTGAAARGWDHITVTRITPSVWRMECGCPLFNLSRTVVTEGWRVKVRDTFSVAESSATAVGIRVAHNATVHGAGDVLNATLPGKHDSIRGFACSNRNLDSSSNRLHRGTFGNPVVHVQATHIGIGLLPLDDVFEAHAWGWQAAVRRQPGSDVGPECDVSPTPSLGLVDEFLALRAGSTYTQEWAVYVAGSDEGTDYWALINRCRRDVGAEGLTIRGAGYLSLASADHHEPFFEDAGFKSWWTMSSAELAGFASTQGIRPIRAPPACRA